MHTALQLWDRIPKWIALLIVLIVPGGLLIATLVAVGLRRSGLQQTAGADESAFCRRNIGAGGSGETERASHMMRSEVEAGVCSKSR
ncbi:MAG: hypothetical protein M3Q32_06230 [Pseudomonadota bacterium]|nr:hypothetical protein [Burkholderiales bacterium]MDQ3195964.1 hypothetical protein [Pseudomonadota bacterium]